MMASLFDLLGGEKETSKSIVGSLFGLSPDLVAQQQAMGNLQSSQNTAMQFAQLDPMQRAQYAMFQGASGAAGGLLSAVGPESAAVTAAKESAILQQKISQLPLNTLEGQQQAMSMALESKRPDIALQLRDIFLKQDLTAARTQAALREKAETPETEAERVKKAQFVAKYGDIGGADAFLQWKQSQKVGVASAGAAQYGGEKIANLVGAQNIVEGYTKKPMERLQAIGEAKTYLGQAGANPAAVPQLRRALVKLGGGDSQVAQREVQQIAGSMGIAGNVAEAVNQFFTGTPRKEQLKLIGQVVQGAEKYYAGQYNKGRQQAETVLGAAKLDPQTRAALLPQEYRLPEQKTYPNAPKTGTVQGGYRFKGGNPADPKNWEKI